MKWFRRIIKKSMQLIPFDMRKEIFRYFAKVPLVLPDKYELKVVENMNELEESFKLVYESYVKIGYCEPNAHKMRATKYHALSTTSTLIAKDNGKVVATLTLVRDNRFGLPLESVFSVKDLRKFGRRVAEVTSLVIDQNYRREAGGLLLFPMMKLMYEYSTDYFGVSYLVIAVHPRDVDFYRALLLFDVVTGCENKDYYGAPATVLSLDLEKARIQYREIFGHRKSQYNYAEFFMDRKFSQIKFPDRSFNRISDAVVSEKDYQKFFVEKLGIEIPSNVISLHNYGTLMRANLRFEVDNNFHFGDNPQSFILKGVVKDVSRNGLRVYFHNEVDLPADTIINIMISKKIKCKLKVRPVWKSSSDGIGLEIIEGDLYWDKYIDYLEDYQSKKVS